MRGVCPLGPAYDRRMPSLPRNSDVADALDELADVSEILGEQGFRVLAYRRAATRVRDTAASVAELALAGKAKELPGIGATIEAKVVELAETGSMSALEKRRAEVPDGGRQFLRLPGLGPKTAARIWRELGVTTLDDLREAAEQQRVRTLQGLGAKSEERILEALAKGFGPEPERRGLLGVGLPVVREIVAALREHPDSGRGLGGGQRASRAGDVPRPRRDRDRDRPARADRPLRRPAVGARGRREGRHEGDRRHEAGPARRPARRAARGLRQPAPALHRLEGPQRRAPRGRAATRLLGLRVRRHGRRDG